MIALNEYCICLLNGIDDGLGFPGVASGEEDVLRVVFTEGKKGLPAQSVGTFNKA